MRTRDSRSTGRMWSVCAHARRRRRHHDNLQSRGILTTVNVCPRKRLDTIGPTRSARKPIGTASRVPILQYWDAIYNILIITANSRRLCAREGGRDSAAAAAAAAARVSSPLQNLRPPSFYCRIALRVIRTRTRTHGRARYNAVRTRMPGGELLRNLSASACDAHLVDPLRKRTPREDREKVTARKSHTLRHVRSTVRRTRRRIMCAVYRYGIIVRACGEVVFAAGFLSFDI